MKKNKLLSITSLTVAGLYLYNKYTNSKAKILHSPNQYSDFQYKWRYGDIYYTKSGNGTPLLFIHDLTPGSSSFEWQYLISEFEKEHTVYLLDLIGCGRSEKPCFEYTNFLFVQLIRDFSSDIIKEKCSVITSGASSSIALMTALYKEDIFDKIIMINPNSITKEKQTVSKENYYKNKFYNLPIIGTFCANRQNKREDYEDIFYNSYFNNPYKTSTSFIDSYYSSYHNNNTSKSLFSSLCNNYTCIDISIALKKLTHPIFIIGGENESNITETVNEYLLEKSDIQFKSIENAKHLPQLECPELLISAIDDSLKK